MKTSFTKYLVSLQGRMKPKIHGMHHLPTYFLNFNARVDQLKRVWSERCAQAGVIK